MNEDNFEFKIGKFHFQMIDGTLIINDVEYQEDEEDPTYTIVRAYWEKLQNDCPSS